MSISGDAKFFRFDGEVLSEISEPGVEVILAVADSWLVEDGRVRNLSTHFARFARWVIEVDPGAEDQLADFFDAVKAALPISGRWFPRIEFHAEAAIGNRLHFRLRTAPDLSATTTLWVYEEADARSNPTVKGPDLSFGMQLRRNAQMHGADEAVLLTAEGFVNEGALSSLVWWRGDVLCSTPENVAWLPSITRQEVFGLARDCGKEIRLELVKPESLADCEVWVLSSFQGIRPASAMVLGNQTIEFAKPSKAEAYQKRLKLLATSVK